MLSIHIRPFILLLAACALVQGMIAPDAKAQQTIFNVPSQDVLTAGGVYGEVDIPFRSAAPQFVAVTPRIVLGLGYHFEGGINLPGYINEGEKLWTAIVALKHGQPLEDNAPWTLTEGLHLYLPLTAGRTIGSFGYLSTAYTFFERLRISAGAYAASTSVTQSSEVIGGLGSAELVINKWLTIAIDGYSGHNALGYVTPGLFVIPASGWILYPGYQVSNISRDADCYLLEIGYTFR